MHRIRFRSTGLEDGGYNATDAIFVLNTDKGQIEIVMPLGRTAELVFDLQTLLRNAYSEHRVSPSVPAGAEAAAPARSVEVLVDGTGDHVLRFTLVDGTSSAIRLNRHIVADAIKALSAP